MDLPAGIEQERVAVLAPPQVPWRNHVWPSWPTPHLSPTGSRIGFPVAGIDRTYSQNCALSSCNCLLYCLGATVSASARFAVKLMAEASAAAAISVGFIAFSFLPEGPG